jgi:GH25 family lysozyme M1 (1,4-beta-N-acetylmuramidase)
MSEDVKKIMIPMVKRISPTSITSDIKGMSVEETREEMKKIFEKFEKQTGYKPIVVGDKSPINILFPTENIKSIDKKTS